MKSPIRFICGIALLVAANAQANDVVLQKEGPGFKQVRLTQEARNAIFESNRESAAELDSSIKTRTNYDVVIIDTYGGLFTSGIPNWAIDDYLADKGVTRANAMGSLKDTKIDQVSFDLVAISQLTNPDLSEAYPPSKTNTEGGLCGKEWKNGTKNVAATPISSSKSLSSTPISNQYVTVGVNGNASATGTLSAAIEYRTKRNKCLRIPYKAELVKATFDAKLNLAANPSLTGKALLEYKKNLFNQYLKFWSNTYGWWIYVFYISLDLEVGMDIGANLNASLAASVDAGFKMDGVLDARYECTRNGCTETRKTSSMNLTTTSYANYSAQLDLILTPYADLAVKANVDLYKFFELGEMKLGLAAGLPIRYFGYVGNMCSDANQDGKNENVTASLLDVTAQSYVYLQFDSFISKKTTKVLDVNPLGWTKVKEAVTFGPATGVNTVYVKNLAFKNLGGDDIFNAVLQFPTPLAATNGAITLSKRSCFPFTSALTYEVDFGDGIIQKVTTSPVLHSWATGGNKTIKARVVSDAAGRNFKPTAWTSRPATISGSTPGTGTGTGPTGGKIYEFNDPIIGNTPGCTLTQTYGAGGGNTVYYQYRLTCPGHQLQVEKTQTDQNCVFKATPSTYSISGSCSNWRVYY